MASSRTDLTGSHNASVEPHTAGKGYQNSHIGFVVGWAILIGSIAVVIIYLYHLYTGVVGQADIMETVAYGWDIAVKVRLKAACHIKIYVAIQGRRVTTGLDCRVKRRG
jgi:hypothetical protein